MTDHERIWLEPTPGADPEYGRQWMHQNVFGDGSTEYVRADLADPLFLASAPPLPSSPEGDPTLRADAPRQFAHLNSAEMIAAREQSPTPSIPEAGDDDRMIQIADLIAQLQEVKDRFGNTCVYIRRGGMGWGAVALNRRSDDEKNGIFDLQAQHDRDMLDRLEQIERLKEMNRRLHEELDAALSAATPEGE